MLFESLRDDPVGAMMARGDYEGLQKLEAKYQRKASRRADIALNGLLHVSRRTRREWELVPIERTNRPASDPIEPSWRKFYESGYKMGAVAITSITHEGQEHTIAAIEQWWGVGGLDTRWVPTTGIAVMQPTDFIIPAHDRLICTADEARNTFERVYDYASLERALQS